MDRHELPWRNVLEVSLTRRLRLHFFTLVGAVASFNFIVTMTIFVCYNLKLVDARVLGWFQIVEILLPLAILLCPFKIFL